jgi:hypothetical protein
MMMHPAAPPETAMIDRAFVFCRAMALTRLQPPYETVSTTGYFSEDRLSDK